MSSKRKRPDSTPSSSATAPPTVQKSAGRPLLPPVVLGASDSPAVNLQVVSGSYEKVLHGFIASIPASSLSCAPPIPDTTTSEKDKNTETALQHDVPLTTTFSDSFLFTAHTAPIRCIALSPPSVSKSNTNSSKRILATGAPDEKINLYTLSASISALPPPSALLDAKARSSASNKHLGTLHEHTNTPSVLLFTPNRNKLISAGEDSQVIIFRTRDWSLLSTLKAPKPKPSASTAGIGLLGNGDRPGGINDIALHPSQKILLSVSKGERVLRMWNLMTGRKAGALAFTKEVMGTMGNRIGGISGEGQKIRWSPGGEKYAVAFEKGVVIFGMDSRPKLRISPSPISKVHQIQYITLNDDVHALALSTEDGRIMFYSTTPPLKSQSTDLLKATNGKAKNTKTGKSEDQQEFDMDNPILLGQLGGREMGMVGRVKDFVILDADIPSDTPTTEKPAQEKEQNAKDKKKATFVVSAGTDGTVRIWHLHIDRIRAVSGSTTTGEEPPIKKVKTTDIPVDHAAAPRRVHQVGSLVGIYETGRRITCLTGMAMDEGWQVEESEKDGDQEDDDSNEESEDE